MFPSPTPSWILISCSVIRGPIWRNRREESFLPWGCQRKPPLPLGLTSVSLTALCWARMLPRPAMAWGSSVMLCSPSGSASLSDSPAPLCEGHTAHHRISGSWDSSGIPWTMAASYPTPSSRGQQLTDVLQAAHVGELLLEKLLHPSTCTHRNDFDATIEAGVRENGG